MRRPREPWDVVVAGVGGMGSAALFHVARRGRRALGLERYWVPNNRGSSHGRSRVFRLASVEGPDYVPLARRALELWRELERMSGERLLRTVGAIDAGSPGSAVFEGARSSCLACDVRHEILDTRDLVRRFPAFQLPSESLVVFQPEGGVLDPERCVETHVRLAEAMGASLRTGVRLVSFTSDEGGLTTVRVRGADGAEEEHTSRALILTVGAWIPSFANVTGASPIVRERQVMGWFRPFTGRIFGPDRFPAFTVEVPEGRYYGFPDLEDEGFKVGRFHHLAERVDPDRMRRTCSDRDRQVLRAFAERYVPEGAGELARMEACLFTNTPDGHFVVDRLPGTPGVVVGAGFSGHGFKFASAVGEVLADLALEGTTSQDIRPFRMDRFDIRNDQGRAR